MPQGSYKYKAFISYSHQDKKWGDWLHKALETYRIPKGLIGKKTLYGEVPKRLFPVFRDREELPTAFELGEVINKALEQSSHLIVICSPRSAKSQWVNEEVKEFKRLGKADRILCLIVDGEPNATDKPDMGQEECFPEAVKYELGDDGNLTSERTEPIAADAREGKDEKANALLKLVAGLLGVGFDLGEADDRKNEAQNIEGQSITTTQRRQGKDAANHPSDGHRVGARLGSSGVSGRRGLINLRWRLRSGGLGQGRGAGRVQVGGKFQQTAQLHPIRFALRLDLRLGIQPAFGNPFPHFHRCLRAILLTVAANEEIHGRNLAGQ